MLTTRYLILTFFSLTLVGQAVQSREVLQQMARGPIEYIYPSNNLYINGACELNLRPDKAVISGAVSGAGFDINQAGQQADTIIERLKDVVKKNKGTYVALERLRSIEGKRCKHNCEGTENRQEFLVMQRVDLEFPLSADIDKVLGQVMGTGMNRFGRNINLYQNQQQRQVLVHYRFSEDRLQSTTIRNTCVNQAIDQWCAETGLPQGHRWCESTDRIGFFRIQNFNLKSQPVLQENGSSRPVQMYYSNGNLTVPEIELMGDVELKLKGTVQLRSWQK